MKAFRQAVEAQDLAAVAALLAPEVEFNSPVSFKPFRGRAQVGFILATVATVFQDFVYTGEYVEPGGPGQPTRSGLRFRTRIGARDAEGVDLIELDGDGLIASLTVMVRPLSAVQALAEAMRAKLDGGA